MIDKSLTIKKMDKQLAEIGDFLQQNVCRNACFAKSSSWEVSPNIFHDSL